MARHQVLETRAVLRHQGPIEVVVLALLLHRANLGCAERRHPEDGVQPLKDLQPVFGQLVADPRVISSIGKNTRECFCREGNIHASHCVTLWRKPTRWEPAARQRPEQDRLVHGYSTDSKSARSRPPAERGHLAAVGRIELPRKPGKSPFVNLLVAVAWAP